MRRLVVALGLACACGTHTTELVADAGGLPGLVALEVTPGDTAVELTDLSAELAVPLTATGTFRDGHRRDVTAEITWATDRDDAGGFPSPGRWVASNRAGGVVTVEARSGTIAAAAHIAITVRLAVTDPAFPPPPGAADGFAAPTPVVTGDPMRSPRIVYPADEVMFPVNLRGVLFQYDAGSVADVLRLRFRSSFLDLQVLTTSDRWRPDAQLWELLARTSAGDKAVMTVAGLASASPTTIWESTAIDVYFSAAAVDGSIYYWSTSSEGVLKAGLAQATPQQFYAQPPDTTCVGCHTLSRDGRRLAVGYGGEILQEVSVPARATIVPASRPMGWSTFSPDGRRLLVADQGVLTLLDADTGAPIGPNGGVVDAGGRATHPDWSPRGDDVVVARCERADDNRNVERCSIVRVPIVGDGWGAPEVLVAAAGPMDNNFFPRYSPDGAWIAYVHAAGKSRRQPTSELRLIPAGGGAPFTLARANHRVGPRDGVAGVGNTMPTWAPAIHRGTQWLAFSSTRDYGKILVGDKPAQLWVVALDLSRTGDPSFAAFWLPFQEPDQRNHRAFWAVDPDVPCDGAGEVCDGLDNDCDGVIDDDCAPCTADERCFDGLDNDCDGVVDDGCVD
ncbi:MAG TPA: MopE-related protein [Kofleriaceae bacterium]|nr:MopE-related protein [Kofleriaceae bacterium]